MGTDYLLPDAQHDRLFKTLNKGGVKHYKIVEKFYGVAGAHRVLEHIPMGQAPDSIGYSELRRISSEIFGH